MMKKITLLVALLVAMTATSFAQTLDYYGYTFDASLPSNTTVTLPWTEHFDVPGAYTNWFSIDKDGDEFPWYLWDPNDTLFSPELHGVLGVTDPLVISVSYDEYEYEPLYPDNWLISPIIPAGATALSWYASAIDPDFSMENYAVYIIPTTTDLTTFVNNPTAANKVYEETLSSDAWVNHSVSLASWTNQSFRIAIRHYNCSDQYVLMIDEISVAGTSVGPDNPDEPGEETAVENATVETFEIVPNPAVDVVTLVGINNEMVNVYDVTGRLVLSQMANGTLNVSSLEIGVYVVKAGEKESRLVVK